MKNKFILIIFFFTTSQNIFGMLSVSRTMARALTSKNKKLNVFTGMLCMQKRHTNMADWAAGFTLGQFNPSTLHHDDRFDEGYQKATKTHQEEKLELSLKLLEEHISNTSEDFHKILYRQAKVNSIPIQKRHRLRLREIEFEKNGLFTWESTKKKLEKEEVEIKEKAEELREVLRKLKKLS